MLHLLLVTLLAAHAQDPVDVGVVRDSDVVVVQKLLYPKTATTEISANLGVMPFDVYTVTPTVQIGVERHLSESVSLGGVVGFGYGLKSGTYRELEVEYGVAPYAFRYLGSALFGVGWSPIYAKANLDGARIVHFDVYLAGRGGVTIEQSLIPGGGTPVAPTLSPAIGTRIFLGQDVGLRLELRDDLLIQARPLTESVAFKQNAAFLAGISILARKGAR